MISLKRILKFEGVDNKVKMKAIIMTVVSLIVMSSMILYSQKTEQIVAEHFDSQSVKQSELTHLQASIAEIEAQESEQSIQIPLLETEIAELELLYSDIELAKVAAEAELTNLESILKENNEENQMKKDQVIALETEQKVEAANASRSNVQLDPEKITNAILIATDNQIKITNQEIKLNKEYNIALVSQGDRLFHVLAVGPKIFVVNFANSNTIDLVQSVDIQNGTVSLEQPVNIVVGE